MKKLALALLLTHFALSAQASEIPQSVKELFFDEIANLVFFEDEGFERAPQKLEDFTYTQTDEFEFSVTGKSFSEWDMKVIGYDCLITVLTREVPTSADDIQVDCTLSDEHWPHL